MTFEPNKPFVVIVVSDSESNPLLLRGTAARQVPLSSIISRSLNKFMSIVSMMPSNHLILCGPLFQHQGFFQWVSFSHQVAKIHIGASASASVLPMNIQGWLTLGLTDLISLLSKGLSRVFFSTTSLKASVPGCSVFFIAPLSHLYMTTGKTIALTIWTFVSKVMSQLFNVLLGLSYLFFQGASVFQFHGYGHHLQWFFSPRK